MKKTIIKVSGMVCNGCENRVKNALGAIEGIKKVDANYKKGIVKVTASEDITLEIMENTIKDLGFDIVKEG